MIIFFFIKAIQWNPFEVNSRLQSTPQSGAVFFSFCLRNWFSDKVNGLGIFSLKVNTVYCMGKCETDKSGGDKKCVGGT